MALSYPRRQTIIIALTCIIIIILVSLYVYQPFSNKKTTDNTDEAVLTTNANQSSTTTIAENNDWKKTFFEVSSSTNSSFKTGTNSASSTPKAITSTDVFGREFFVAYTQLKQADLINSTSSVANATNKIISDSLASMPVPTEYKISDINITKKEDFQTLSTYADSLINTLRTNVPQKNQVYIASDAIDTGDMTLLKQIDPIIEGYTRAIRKLVSMSVPQIVASYHIDVVNGISIELYNAQALRNLELDPVRGLVAINQEVPALEMLGDSLTNMKALLGTKGVLLDY